MYIQSLIKAGERIIVLMKTSFYSTSGSPSQYQLVSLKLPVTSARQTFCTCFL